MADIAPQPAPLPEGPCALSDEHWEATKTALGLPDGLPASSLSQALCHASYARETGAGPAASNQRLEFLGDAVLDVILAEHLYRAFPDVSEGRLTKMKAAAVRAEALAEVARRLDLGGHLLLGRGEEDTGGRSKPSLLADALEALIGSVYLSCGLEQTRQFVLGVFADLLQAIEFKHSAFDHKTALQELLQDLTRQTPTYHTVQTTGPPHDRRFAVEVRFAGQCIGAGEGPSKQLAQQAAAGAALAARDEWLPRLLPDRPAPTGQPARGGARCP